MAMIFSKFFKQVSKSRVWIRQLSYTKGTMAKSFVVVKYGGSAITEKSKFETLKRDILHATAEQVRLIRENSNASFVIIHGAGSFGHFQAHQYDLRNGGGNNWLFGLSKTRESVTKLNHMVTAAHCAVGIPAVAVSLFPSAQCHNKTLTKPGPMSHIRPLVDAGFVPIIHGDVVLDTDKKCCVYSGDSILKWVVRDLCDNQNVLGRAVDIRVLFLTDVAGIYDKPPGQSHVVAARLIDQIYVDTNGKVTLSVETESMSHDVTGGIVTKLQCAADIVKECGVDVFMAQAGSTHAARVMAGENIGINSVLKWIGTKVSAAVV